MKIVNRGYISIKAKQPYIDWVNEMEGAEIMDAETEANIYLIEEDFFDEEPVLKAKFKAIFRNELMAISEDEENYPVINIETFNDWFKVEMGASVFDCVPGGLKSE